MLVLTRRIRESVIINNDTKITFLGFNGKQIRLGIAAPKNVPIVREEIANIPYKNNEINEQENS